MGGVLAHEVAAQLIGQDQMVEFLGLFDTLTPAVWHPKNVEDRPYASHQRGLLEMIDVEALDAGQSAALEKLKAADGIGFGELLDMCLESGLLATFEGYTATEIQEHAKRLMAHSHAYEKHALKQISIPLHLFAAEEEPPDLGRQPGADVLGWGSVLPVQQIRRIEVPGNHQTMMKDPHIAVLGERLSIAIAQSSSQQTRLPEMLYRPHVTIQTGNHGNSPIFCVPGAGDSVTSFFDLANAVGDMWPLHGLQPRGSDGILIPHSTVEAAASSYLSEMDAICPKGPVHLLGHSFGGWVALEMAHRMGAMNRSVASLTVVDSEIPGAAGAIGREYTPIDILRRLIEVLEMSAETSLNIDLSELELLEEPGQLGLLHQRMVRVGLLHRNSTAEVLRGVLATFAAALRTNYRPQQSYTGPLRLVLASDATLDEQTNRRQHHETLRGWRKCAMLPM